MSARLFREKLYLSKKGGRNVFIPENFAPYLSQYQRDALRFLCRQFYKMQPGAIVSSPSGCGKTAAAALLLEALRSTLRPLASLVLCRPERLDHWLYHLQLWTDSALETLEQSNNIHSKKELFLCPMSAMANLARRDWGIIVVDVPIEGLNILQLQPLKAKYKIWLTDSNILENLPSLDIVYQWLTKEKMDLKIFGKKGIKETERHIALDIFCQDFLFMNTSNCTPLLSEERHKQLFRKWQTDKSLDRNLYFQAVTDKSVQPSNLETTIPEVMEVARKNKDATGLKIKRSKKPEPEVKNNDKEFDVSSKIPRLSNNIVAMEEDASDDHSPLKASLKRVEELANEQFKGSLLDSLF